MDTVLCAHMFLFFFSMFCFFLVSFLVSAGPSVWPPCVTDEADVTLTFSHQEAGCPLVWFALLWVGMVVSRVQ